MYLHPYDAMTFWHTMPKELNVPDYTEEQIELRVLFFSVLA